MKTLITALLLTASAAAHGADIVPAHRAHKVHINGATYSIEGEHGWPITHVKASATFSNPCRVPSADELVVFTDYADSYGTLNITVAAMNNRLCTAEYAPVTVTIDLGTYTRPNDGLFDTINVNGVAAQSAE